MAIIICSQKKYNQVYYPTSPITAKQFANYLYCMHLDEDSDFINNITDEFPLISLFELVDNPDNYMKDLGYFMETEFHYIYLFSFTSG